MKKAILVLSVLVLCAAVSQAQVPSPFSVYVGGAISVPNSPSGFKDTYNTGYHGFAGLGFKMAPNFQVIGKIEYNTFSFDFDNTSWATGLTDGGNENLLMFGADGRFSLGAPAVPFKPFIFGGGGLAHITMSEFEGTDLSLVTSVNELSDISENKFYFNIGAGAEFKAGPAFSFFAQARYVSVATEGESAAFIPISLGLKFF